MKVSSATVIGLGCFTGQVLANQWPYERYYPKTNKQGDPVADKAQPEFGDQDRGPENQFGEWLGRLINQGTVAGLQDIFTDGSLPKHPSFDDIWKNVKTPVVPPNQTHATRPPGYKATWPQNEAEALLGHLPWPLDQRCTASKDQWWYRTYNGSCNWLKDGEMNEGMYGVAKSRDYGQHHYADGISMPREGPNPRALSNAFFKRKEVLYFEHTPFLLGIVEFIMHDITWSSDSRDEYIDVPVPDDEKDFPLNTTFRVYRTEAAPGTGTSRENPRENINRATTWLDLSSLYGSTPQVAMKLRSFKDGKLLTQKVKAQGTKKAASYLPFNSMGVPVQTRPGVSPETLFAGGDPRTNEDWIMLGVHTLLLREHNRMCDLLKAKKPAYDDEEIYQTVRLLMSAKFSLIGNAYQMAYFKDMPWPNDDGFPLYREMSGDSWLEINPANNYPWPLVTKEGKPTVVSAEMAVVYRFHEFIVKTFPIKDALNNTMWDQNLFATAFNATGFIDAGLENIMRGTAASFIPNFKSGVEEDFRSAGKYRGSPFDIVVWSIVHEREQGLPTFNEYFAAYNKGNPDQEPPEVQVPIRKRFEDFSSDPKMVAELKRLYKNPDEVDLVVGCQLDETMFPHATIPTSSLIISLFSLISMGNSDRFSIGFAAMRCLLVDKPWDCHPSNALEELLWKPVENEAFPNARFYDEYWMAELDFQAHGQNLLWRLVTENSEINCLQKNPLFPLDEKTNPLLCALPESSVDIRLLLSTGVEVTLSLIKIHYVEIIATIAAVTITVWLYSKINAAARGYPKVLGGLPFLGKALDFQKDAKAVVLEGFRKFGGRSVSSVFGIHLASLTHYVISNPQDVQSMIDDAPYEMKFNLSKLLEAVNVPIILRQVNFASNLHTNLVRTHLGDPATVQQIGRTMQVAAIRFLETNPPVPATSNSHLYSEGLTAYINQYITSVCARCMVGPEAYEHPELIDMFLEFNKEVDKVIGLGSLLPSWMSFFTHIPMNKGYNKFRKIFLPIVAKRRAKLEEKKQLNGAAAGGETGDKFIDFMSFILDIVDDDERAADLVTITVWFGLRNLQITLLSTLLDMIDVPGLADQINLSLSRPTRGVRADLSTLNTFTRTDSSAWALLRAAMFESIRLCGPASGPARIISSPHDLALASDPSVKLPPGQVATLSSFYSHRMPENYGPDAKQYNPQRFLTSGPDIGSKEFITWGLKGPHTCPGRWFTQEAICIMMKEVLERYKFEPARTGLDDDEKYEYHAGVVTRKEVPVTVYKRSA
ncbi:Peroxidase [Colletotrichum siamense]|uniref:Peroxidase n=1 Tax=Colletotrichum siamense TaxID=690259 RepID=UPI001872DD86|nr:Peroxidase [Colletotrichum siamense]KAF5497051.1 Peroxidase [Colletotrichum siamense]